MTTLLQHIQAENEKTRAWVAADPKNRWATTWTEDMSHWTSMGVTTVDEFHIYNFQQSYSDMHKDTYGFRPRHDTSDWDMARWEQEMESLGRAFDEEQAREKARKERAITDYENEIQFCLDNGAGSREKALAWMLDARELSNIDLMYGGESLCHDMGLPYNGTQEKELDIACKELLKERESQEAA